MAKGVIGSRLDDPGRVLHAYTNATGGTVDNNFNNLATNGCLLDGTVLAEAWEVSTLLTDGVVDPLAFTPGTGRPILANVISGKHYVRASTADTEGSQTANTVFASPDGVAGSPVFRALVSADLPASPTLTAQTLTNTTNQLVLGTTRTWTINAPTPASSSRTATIPDAGANANFLMSAGNQTATGTLTINKAGIAATATNGLLFDNTTSATSGVPVQQSPSLEFKSHVWNTTSVAADNTFEARVTLVPTSGTTPSGTLIWETNNNGGGWVKNMSINDSGVLNTTEAALTKTSAQITLGASAHKTILSATAPSGASQTLTIPDAGGAATFALKVAAPANAGDTGVAGNWAADANYIYVCTATNTWKRVAIATW